jgi:hypothetical protein
MSRCGSHAELAWSTSDGNPERGHGLLIAATAHAHHATLYTRKATDAAGPNDLITVTPA